MLRAAWLLLALASAAIAGEADVSRMRHLSDATPAQALDEGRKLLDGGKLSDDSTQAREVLRWMGRAAIILSDDAAIAEVVLRLDGLAQTHADTVAKAYAGFLRAQRLQSQNRARDGLAEALSSADLLQEKKDPQPVRCLLRGRVVRARNAVLPACKGALARIEGRLWRSARDQPRGDRALQSER
jgi:hypothetical protein